MSVNLPDVSAATVEAAALADTSELMGVYAELGRLLDSGRSDDDYPVECRDLVGRLAGLGEEEQRESDQRWAVWMAQHTTFGGGG